MVRMVDTAARVDADTRLAVTLQYWGDKPVEAAADPGEVCWRSLPFGLGLG